MKKASYKSVFTLFAALACMHGDALFAQSSVLHSGTWYKVAVDKNGVYKIDFNLFKKMGFNPSQTDPRKIKIFGNEGGMLPQANSASRPVDLQERSIYVHGENDGTFNSGDYILFYAQGPDRHSFDEDREIFFYEKNLYADKNYYYITVGETNGMRVSAATDPGNSFPTVTEFENFIYYELDQYSILKSGRVWYGERFNASVDEVVKSLPLSNIIPGSTIKLVSDVMSQSLSTSSFKVYINGVQIADQTVPSIPGTDYGAKGEDKRDTILTNATTVGAAGRTSQELKYVNASPGYLDYFLLQVTQQLAMYNQQTIFRSVASVQNPVSKFLVGQATTQTVVWDITNPYQPMVQPSSISSGVLSFSTVTGTLKEFIAFSSSPSPELIESVPNQNLHGLTPRNFVIVTHPDFKEEAQRLANHRAAHNGITTAVVTTLEVYNEFSSGRQDVSAIRDFAKMMYDKNPGVLKSMLLFGKGSYDYKNRVVDNVNLVPVYESRNSLLPLQTYSSDDFFSFLENNEGTWGEDPIINHTMDIGVGRLPVKNATEAKNVVDKIIRYDIDETLLGTWRKDIVFVADDGDGNLHQRDANDLAKIPELNQGAFNVRKIYLDQFPQESLGSRETSTETSTHILNSFYNGALVINYIGHGGTRVWADETIFDAIDIERLENARLPLLINATCDFGRLDDPIFMSGAELCVLRKQGGSIGSVATGRPVFSSTNFLLNQAFYNAFFEKENNAYLNLGEIFRRTKNNSASGISNRNFSLIGDPSLMLAFPEYTFRVTGIQTADGSSVLKALSTVTVTGEVVNDALDVVSDFNGILEATLFDKETSFITLGNENSPFPYKQWFNAIFRGKATVSNGLFEFQFVIPKNIAYQIDEGKLSLYAYDPTHRTEASGYSQDFEVGSSETNPDEDTTPPALSVFVGDTTFVSGGIVGSNTLLVARLHDAHGINISGYGIGNSIIGTLDDAQTFVLNDYYIADVDDFTRGTISYPLNNLSPGRHTLHVQAWDTYNNPVSGSVDFIVSDGNGILIETFGNYPNPFTVSTKLFFTHNSPGDDLQASVILYDRTGQLIESYDFDIPDSSYKVELMELDYGGGSEKKRPGGLYFARLVVRSATNGSKNEQVTKLILLN